MCENVVDSSPEGSKKVAMMKRGVFLTLETRKALENQGHQRNSP
jgi:hypothetical protein